jgi:hypothetical protein
MDKLARLVASDVALKGTARFANRDWAKAMDKADRERLMLLAAVLGVDVDSDWKWGRDPDA